MDYWKEVYNESLKIALPAIFVIAIAAGVLIFSEQNPEKEWLMFVPQGTLLIGIIFGWFFARQQEKIRKLKEGEKSEKK